MLHNLQNKDSLTYAVKIILSPKYIEAIRIAIISP